MTYTLLLPDVTYTLLVPDVTYTLLVPDVTYTLLVPDVTYTLLVPDVTYSLSKPVSLPVELEPATISTQSRFYLDLPPPHNNQDAASDASGGSPYLKARRLDKGHASTSACSDRGKHR